MNKLIVNKDGHLSALPTQDEFSLGGFVASSDRFVCYDVEVDPLDYIYIWEHRDGMIVIGPDLPIKTIEAIVDPNWSYVQILSESPLRLVPVYVPDLVRLNFARQAAIGKLATTFAGKKQGRFASAALGTVHYYDGSDFLPFALAFVTRGLSGLFTCASDVAAPFTPALHTVDQMRMVGEDFAAWYQELQGTFYDKQGRLLAATTLAEVAGIDWV